MPFKDTLKKLSELKDEISDHFEDIRDEMEQRFQTLRQRDPDEIFRELPPPSGLSMPLMQALEHRASSRTFSNEPIPDQILSNLLYAADGINRDNGRKTTASALDWQDTEIYVLKPNGIWRWVPERCGLIFCSMKDIRAKSCYAQPTVAKAPLHLVFVSNKAKTKNLLTDFTEKLFVTLKNETWTPYHIAELRMRSQILNVGLKMHSVSLAASAMDLACVCRTGFPTSVVHEELHLKKEEMVVAAVSIGFKPRSILDHIN